MIAIIGSSSGKGGAVVPSLADPSSFADVFSLWRSDAGVTLVYDRCTIWADQSGNRYNIISVANDAPYLLSNKGAYGFADLFSASAGDNSKATIPTQVIDGMTHDFVFTNTYAYNPEGYTPCFANVNQVNQVLRMSISGNYFYIYVRQGSNSIMNRYLLAATGKLENIRGTAVYDGTEPIAQDRIKFYRNGVLQTVATHYLVGTAPSTGLTTGTQFNLSSSTTARRSSTINLFHAGWLRSLTPAEILENDTWKQNFSY